MPIDQKTLPDGNLSFDGGMDASKHPSMIRPNGYFSGINLYIPREGGGITQRGGFHCQHIDWSQSPSGKEIYEHGHIQGEGWYWSAGEVALLRSVSGYVVEFREISEGFWSGKLLNGGNPNDSKTTKAWFTRIPGGSILNDGVKLPMIISNGSYRRSDPSNGEITTGRMGVYVQNRFFYVDPTGSFIQASDFRQPYSIRNSSATNIHGFLNPQDENEITAIGRQKALLGSANSALIGTLAWSDGENLYGADVRGDRQNWEILNSNIGKVNQSVPSVGATSSYSFENFNTNLYFRNADYGLCDLRQSQYQFVREADFESQSIEVAKWFGNDTDWMLDQCYTRKYKNRLYTTTGPQISDDGYVYWNGLVVSHPNPGGVQENDIPRRYETLITGVRPWCITSTFPPTFKKELFVDSYDPDGVNRLYKYKDDVNFDLNSRGDRIEIESMLETRAYESGLKNEPKNTFHRQYSLGGLYRDVNIQIYTRPEGYGQYMKQFDRTHRVQHSCSMKSSSNISPCFRPMPIKPQERSNVPVENEPSNDSKNPDYAGGVNHYSRQYLFKFKGPFRLYKFLTLSKAVDFSKAIVTQGDEDAKTNPYIYLGLNEFEYSIHEGNNNSLLQDWIKTTDEKPN